MSELRRYLGHFRPHAGVVLLGAGLLSVAALVPAATVVLLQQTVDAVLVGGRPELLAPICLGFALLALLRAGVVLVRTRLTKGVAWQVSSDLRRRLHRHFLALDDESPVGSRLAALLSEVDELQYGVSALVTALRNPLSLVGLATTAVWMAPRLAPWALLLLPPVVLTARWSGRRVSRAAHRSRTARASLSALAADQLAARQLVEAQDAVDEESRRFGALDRADRDARVALEVERILPSAATAAVVGLAGAVLLWVGAGEVLAGRMEPGALLGFAVALGLMHRPLGGLAEVWALWQRSLAALERVHGVLERPLPADPADARALPDGPLELTVEGLHADHGGPPVLRGVDLALRPGEIVALVGPSGAGKSTLLAVLADQLAPRSGNLALGGHPRSEARRADWRQAVALVSQRNQLLDRTLAENLRLGRPDAPDAALHDALARAGCTFVAQLERGLDTRVGEHGTRLSGGERQRLCLARALLGAPRVLLLDEATNQIDPEAEQAILGALRAHAADVAVLLVAHDRATAALADRVLVLEDGRITPGAADRVVA